MLEKNDIIGDYTLAEFLGKGQFGEVWLGEKKLQFGSRKFRHALKFLSNIADEIDFKNAEAEVDTWIEASGHPNVMSVLDMLVHKEHIIIVSEFAENGSLKRWLDQNNKKAPSNEKAVEMMRGILRGIEHLHSRNIVHRDLKPDNILLQGNFPRLADFGISRIILENSALTKAMGSPAYMSPESFLGNKSPQTDIWSAGVILYEMLTGKYPFGGETIYALIDSIGKDAPQPLPENIPAQLQEVIYKALEKDRSNRYQTAGEMNDALKNVWVSVENEARRKREWEIEQERVRAEAERAKLQKQLEESEKSVIEERRKREEGDQRRRDELERTQRSVENKREKVSSYASPVETIEADFAAQIRQRELEEKRKQAEETRESEKNVPIWKIAVGVGGLFAGVALIAILFVALTNNKESKNNDIAKNEEIVKSSPAIEMVKIPAGSFMMGSNNGNEKPVHKVIISRDFWMGKTEVTQAQWKTVAGDNPSEFKGDDLPVEKVSWDDVQEFIRKLNSLQNDYKYRLPTEAEWEYAARAGTTGDYAGSPDSTAWYNANSNGKTHLVGQKQPNGFGLYDMHGNVWEWTADWYDSYSGGTLTDPTGAGIGSNRVNRGGGWFSPAGFLRSAYRGISTPSLRGSGVGFRLLRE